MTDAERKAGAGRSLLRKRRGRPWLAEQKRRQDREAELGARIKALPDRRFAVI
jgi:hypothetical protein